MAKLLFVRTCQSVVLRAKLDKSKAFARVHSSRTAASFRCQTPPSIDVEDRVMEFKSRRSPVLGRRGMVACTQPLAAEAGMRILQQGGNAVDASVAVAAALNVTEPCCTGIGGDAFALIYKAEEKRVEAVLGCGKSPSGMTLEYARSQGVLGKELPVLSALTVTVPGAAALWEDVVQVYGQLTLKQVLQPAIELANGGFPVGPVTAHLWSNSLFQIRHHGEEGAKYFTTSEGLAPKAGQLLRNPDLAATFRRLADHGASAGFYKGRIASAIVEALQARGSSMTLQDLATHTSTFTQPISTCYRGHTVYEVPPPTQGIAALMALNYLESANDGKVPGTWGSSGHLHASIEAMRLAFADTLAFNADPEVVNVPVDTLLSKEYAKQRLSQCFSTQQAATVSSGQPEVEDLEAETRGGDTVYFCVVDGKGNACSFINSNYDGFGSGIVPKGCGFTLQNRGNNFILDSQHPNCLAPNKRPYHTIIPGLATDQSGEFFATFGVMGGFMQPQGHLQVISNMLDYGMEPQAALDAPRWSLSGVDSWLGPKCVESSKVLLEEGFDAKVVAELEALGHQVRPNMSGFQRTRFGRGQIIARNAETGVLWGGSEPRADGQVLGW